MTALIASVQSSADILGIDETVLRDKVRAEVEA